MNVVFPNILNLYFCLHFAACKAYRQSSNLYCKCHIHFQVTQKCACISNCRCVQRDGTTCQARPITEQWHPLRLTRYNVDKDINVCERFALIKGQGKSARWHHYFEIQRYICLPMERLHSQCDIALKYIRYFVTPPYILICTFMV